MKTKKKAVISFLVSLLMMSAVFSVTANANEYFDVNGLTNNAVFELGKEIEFSVVPHKFAGSKWASRSNFPNYVYVRIYKGTDAEPCKSSTFSYNTDGAAIKDGWNIMLPEKVGEPRTVTYTPEAEGTYTVKMLWQNYDAKDKKEEPELKEEFTFTVKAAEEPAENASDSAGTEPAEKASDPSGTEPAEKAAAPAAAASAKEVKDLPAVTIAKPKAAKKSATVKWKKISSKIQKKIAGVEIQYSTDKKFRSGVKTKTAKKTAVSKKITKLKSKKTYYIRIRTYKKIKGVKHVSKWSKVKAVKVK